MRVKDATSAIKAFSEAVRGNVVTADTVVKRAEICAACPAKKRTVGVSRASEILGLVANKHRVPVDIAGYSCGVCGCSLMMLLPATTQDLHKDSAEEAAARPAACWIKQS